MKKEYKIVSTMVAIMTIVMLIGCDIWHKPDINGSKKQPIMHGWTHAEAGEFWLAVDLDDDRGGAIRGEKQWLTAEQLADFSDENVRVMLKLAPEGTDPQPRNAIRYRQSGTDGYICFNLDKQVLNSDTILSAALDAAGITADQLMTVGTAEYWLKEPGYFPQDTVYTGYVQRRGRGIYTLFSIVNRGTRKYPKGQIASISAVIAVHEGGDSLSICRGNILNEDYVAE